MRKLENAFKKMERRAYIFLKIGLETLGFVGILLLISILKNTYTGAQRYIFVQSMSNSIIYLLLSFSLVVGGGLFIDFAIKREKM